MGGRCTTRSASEERREREEIRLRETPAAVTRLIIAREKAKRRKAIEILDARIAELGIGVKKGLNWLGRERRYSAPEVGRTRSGRREMGGEMQIQVSPPSPTTARK